jgi:hypothetical protein
MNNVILILHRIVKLIAVVDFLIGTQSKKIKHQFAENVHKKIWKMQLSKRP